MTTETNQTENPEAHQGTDNPVDTRYVSIDIETTGLNPKTDQVLEVGAVIDDGITPVDELPKFHCYVKHHFISGHPRALSMNAEIIRRIDDGGENVIEEHYIATKFAEWLTANGVDPKKFTAAGKNFAGFDRPFLDQQLTGWKPKITPRHRVIDPALMYWRPEIDGFKLPDTQTCLDRADFDKKVQHTALEDATDVVRLIRLWSANRKRITLNSGNTLVLAGELPNGKVALVGDWLCDRIRGVLAAAV